MAGGGGSKERRRLARLKKSAPAKSGDSGNVNKAKPRRSHGGDKPAFKPRSKPHVAAKVTKSAKFTKKAPAKKKPKVKKPKHLKRKLEQISDDAQAREQILVEMQQFAKLKEHRSGAKPMLEKTAEKPQDEPSAVAVEKPRRRRGRKDNSNEKLTSPQPEVVPSPPKRTKVEPVAKKETEDETKDDSMEAETEQRVDTNSEEIESNESSDSESEHGDNSDEEDDSDDDDDDRKEKADSPKESDPGSDSSDSDSDSDSDDAPEEPTRQRGKRRRGRQDTSKFVTESVNEVAAATEKTNKHEKKGEDKPRSDRQDASELASESVDEVAGTAAATEKKGDPQKKTSKKDDKRRCRGRKPVTDYTVGNAYPATVVYCKPYGVFFDIGCHSDAFCHVSRLSDGFVESPSAMFKEGDKAEVRVIEIDRRSKRITLSLQSEARAQDEQASQTARVERKQSRQKKTQRESPAATVRPQNQNRERFNSTPTEAPLRGNMAPSPHQPRKIDFGKPEAKFHDKNNATTKDESNMTPAELKRARKLARRAARRGAQEGTTQ